MNNWFLLVAIISAGLGCLVTWIAGELLLRRILPRRQEGLAADIASAIDADRLSGEIREQVSNPETIARMMPVIELYVDDFLRNKLKTRIPMIGMLIGEKTIQSLREIFLQEISTALPHVLNEFANQAGKGLDLEGLVAAQVNGLTPGKWRKGLSPLLRYFTLAGCVTGLLIGLVNGIIFFSVY
jgi:hypothetical protein